MKEVGGRSYYWNCFQFLGIPPKGEQLQLDGQCFTTGQPFPISRDPPEGGTMEQFEEFDPDKLFPISRDPPEGGTPLPQHPGDNPGCSLLFPISRDPPEGGTHPQGPKHHCSTVAERFPISRDPPEGGTAEICNRNNITGDVRFQFLGIPPKGELHL